MRTSTSVYLNFKPKISTKQTIGKELQFLTIEQLTVFCLFNDKALMLNRCGNGPARQVKYWHSFRPKTPRQQLVSGSSSTSEIYR